MRKLSEAVYGTETREIIGAVAGRHVIIYDTLLRSGKTLLAAVDAYLRAGATAVSAVVTHFVPTKPDVIRQLQDSPLDVLIVTNSHPNSQAAAVRDAPKIHVVDVTPVFLDQVVVMEGIGGCYSLTSSPVPPLEWN